MIHINQPKRSSGSEKKNHKSYTKDFRSFKSSFEETLIFPAFSSRDGEISHFISHAPIPPHRHFHSHLHSELIRRPRVWILLPRLCFCDARISCGAFEPRFHSSSSFPLLFLLLLFLAPTTVTAFVCSIITLKKKTDFTLWKILLANRDLVLVLCLCSAYIKYEIAVRGAFYDRNQHILIRNKRNACWKQKKLKNKKRTFVLQSEIQSYVSVLQGNALVFSCSNFKVIPLRDIWSREVK